jgi:hypothetical protein
VLADAAQRKAMTPSKIEDVREVAAFGARLGQESGLAVVLHVVLLRHNTVVVADEGRFQHPRR